MTKLEKMDIDEKKKKKILKKKNSVKNEICKNKKISRCRNYCLTFFTCPKMELLNGVRYFIVGREICPSTKNEHWQCYIELYNSQTLTWIKKAFEDNTVHIEGRRGTRDDARNYCKKDGEFYEFGKWISGQGHRTDLEEIASTLVNSEATLNDIMTEAPSTYCRYRNGLKDLAALGNKKKSKDFRILNVILITGPTGCGKTRQAMEEAEYRIQGTQLAWWQDYDGETCICIDEYNNDVNITELLNLLDGYQLRLNIKGSHTYANWTKVFITTNLKLDEIHPNAKQAHRDALFRRITTVINLWDELSHPN